MLTEQVGGKPIDMGAMLLVGTVGNPLVTLCEQVGCSLHTLDRSSCPLYDGETTLDEPREVGPQLVCGHGVHTRRKLRIDRCRHLQWAL